jgi:3-deoxy-D-manno-octulosonate 8-phosphate phosphatase (KDO 8-P phosphatase)
MKSEVLSKIREIKLFLFDLEGVLLNSSTSLEKCFDSISKVSNDFSQHGLRFGIVTARSEDEFIKKLKSIDNCIVLAGSLAKVDMTDNYLHSHSINYQNVLYMGDDLLDIPLLQKCGLSCAPKSARREVKRAVSFTTSADN